jgi:hypothetical protein
LQPIAELKLRAWMSSASFIMTDNGLSFFIPAPCSQSLNSSRPLVGALSYGVLSASFPHSRQTPPASQLHSQSFTPLLPLFSGAAVELSGRSACPDLQSWGRTRARAKCEGPGSATGRVRQIGLYYDTQCGRQMLCAEDAENAWTNARDDGFRTLINGQAGPLR